jgi:catechol 2,3-dioxygenase-like lactoylglutathione lyase family enzyme
MGLSDNRVGATIAVSDMDQARGFYEGKLGLTPGGMEGPHGVLYQCGEGSTLLVYHSPEHAGKATATVATWEVPDLDRTVDELAANGVTFERYEGFEGDERAIHPAGEDGAGRIAWFKDPEGNTIAVGQFD